MNVATQRWIRVFDQQNRLTELPLADVLIKANKLKTIHGSTPLERVALFRLALALLYRTCQPETESEAEQMLTAGRFEAKRIKSYLAVKRGRFNLFDDEHPFYQYASPPAGLRVSNINRLFLTHATGIKGTLHSHIHDTTKMDLTPAQAARAVVTAQCFLAAGGKSGRPGLMFRHTGPLRQTNFILEGRSLFETFWLHLFPKELSRSLSPFFPGILPSAEDLPVWERDDPEKPFRQQPQGPLDALTYPCRLIKLKPDSNRVNQAIVSQSLGIKENVPLFDPTVAYRFWPGEKGKGAKVAPVKVEQGFLQELDLFDPESDNRAFPVYTRWRDLIRKGCLDDPNSTLFTATGVEYDKNHVANIHRIYNYHLQFPAEILVDRERLHVAKKFGQEMSRWSRIGSQALETGIKSLHPSRQKNFHLLPQLFEKQFRQIAEGLLASVLAGSGVTDWEPVVSTMVKQQADILPMKAKAITRNEFSRLRAWQRKFNEEDNDD